MISKSLKDPGIPAGSKPKSACATVCTRTGQGACQILTAVNEQCPIIPPINAIHCSMLPFQEACCPSSETCVNLDKRNEAECALGVAPQSLLEVGYWDDFGFLLSTFPTCALSVLSDCTACFTWALQITMCRHYVYGPRTSKSKATVGGSVLFLLEAPSSGLFAIKVSIIYNLL